MGRSIITIRVRGENDLAGGSTCTYDISSSEYGSNDPPLRVYVIPSLLLSYEICNLIS